mmetsp:Transcript_19070/g.32670  ORF Transcript_19070/g.32670 Transcript_19070/m.32670 type:complete len:141 (+) Transcript_19070:462-884(+)
MPTEPVPALNAMSGSASHGDAQSCVWQVMIVMMVVAHVMIISHELMIIMRIRQVKTLMMVAAHVMIIMRVVAHVMTIRRVVAQVMVVVMVVPKTSASRYSHRAASPFLTLQYQSQEGPDASLLDLVSYLWHQITMSDPIV